MDEPRVELEFYVEGVEESELVPLLDKIALHLDTYYSNLGGGGLRMPDIMEDDLMGVETYRARSREGYDVTLRLLRRNLSDDSLLVHRVQEYICSEHFESWVDSLEEG